MNILILQPIRPTNPLALRAVADALLSQLPAANPGLTFDIRQDDSALDIPPHPSLYMRHAAVRNYMLDTYLKPEHDAVLWVDSDLIDYPADLPTRLANVIDREARTCDCDTRARHGVDHGRCRGCGRVHSASGSLLTLVRGVIAAPMAVLSPSSGFQDRFYDIGGFIENGTRANMFRPWFRQAGPVIELDSVGCCYLAPAWLYQAGVRYGPPPTDYYVEHWSVMQQARARGVRIVALTDVQAVHAWLPDYGLEVN